MQNRWPTDAGKKNAFIDQSLEAGRVPSGRQFSGHEVDQRTYGGKGGAVNLVVVDDEAETFFQAGDQRHDGHRIQFGNRPEQMSVQRVARAATVQAKRLV